MVGKTIGHYQITAELGRGGMGEVYQAYDTRLGRAVALKFLADRSGKDRSLVDRFVREARAASALNHPNIITIHDIGETEEGRFLVMELIEGSTLRGMAPLGLAPMAEILVQVAKALHVAHQAGIVHRDIKPDNIMVRADGYVKVLDFGLARLVPKELATTGPAAETVESTDPGMLVGTFRYMSPEQARGEVVHSGSDIFSLGIVCYELATGQHPFRAESPIGVLHSIMTKPAEAPARLNSAISPSLDALILQMLAKDPRARPTAAEVEAALGGKGVVVAAGAPVVPAERHTVGREKERAGLRAAFESVAAGRGLLLCVAGEAGIGKTTLVEDLFLDLAADGQVASIARGRCSERLAGAEAYLPLLEALESLLHGPGGDSAARVMKQTAPTWYVQVAPMAVDDTSAARLLTDIKSASPERMKRELSAFFQEVSRLRPLVVFFDDLQWADVSTIDMLAYLAGKFDSLRALIVVTYRPSDLALAKHPFLQIRPNLLAHGLCRETQLDFLTLPDIERYLALEFPGQWFPPEFAALVLARTEGNALFMADLARYLRDRKVIVEERGQWTLTHTLADIERELPESVRGMIQRKIDQLEEADRQLLVAASVEGPEFNSAVLSKALGLDPAEVEDRLEELDRAHALVRLIGEEELPDRTLTLRYRFVHLLYQNALYGSLRPTRRASLSGAVARALEGFHGQPGHKVASQLAFLFASARDFPKASSYFFLAARNAAQVFAHREAVTLARRGLDLLKSVSESAERNQQELKLQITLGVSLMASKGYAAPEVEKAYLRARQLCLESGETKRLFPVLWSLWVFYLVGAKFDKAREMAEELQRPAERTQDPAVLAQAYHAMGTTQGYQGEFAAARSYFERGIAVYDPRQHRSATFLYLIDPAVGCRCLLARALWLEGRPEEAVEKVQEALTIGESLAHPQSLAYALVVGSMTLQLHHQVARAQQQAEAGSALAREHGLPQVEPWGTIVLGWTLVEQGRHQEGIAQMQASLKMQRAIGSELDRPYCLALLAEALAKAGQVERGLTALAEALEAAQSTGERYYEAELHRLQGELLLEQGAGRAEAKACFARALEVARRQGARSLELRAAASLARVR